MAQQVGRLGLGERPEFDAFDEVVGPQRADRVGQGLAGPDRTEDRRAFGARHVVDKRRRQRVEQVRVVDREHDRASGGLPVQRVDGPSQEPGRGGAGRLVGRQDRGQPAERQAGGRRVGGSVPHRQPVGVDGGDTLPQQPALADAGGSTEDQSTSGRARGHVGQTGQFGSAPDKAPRGHRRTI